MDGIYEMAGSPVPVTIGGKQYLLGPLTAEDEGTIELQILSERRKPADVLAEMLHKMQPEQQRMLLEIAWTDEVRGPRVKRRDYYEWLATKRGRLFRLWLLFKRNHPEITQREVERLLEQDSIAAAESAGQPLGNSSPPVEAGGSQATSTSTCRGVESGACSPKSMDGPPTKSAA